LDKLTERALGVSFSSGKIYYTELFLESGIPVLDHVETAEIDFDFESELSAYKSNQKALTNISDEIQKYINKRALEYSNVSLAIGTSQAFLITLPIDYSEGKQSINAKIYWELSNFFPDNYNDFIVNTYRMNAVKASGKTDDFLIIAVLKNTLEFVKRIFKLCNIDLMLVDIDHFSAEHMFRKNYPGDISEENILLVGLKKGRVDYGLISNGKYNYYTYSKYSSEPEFNLNLVRKINALLGEKLAKLTIHKIVLYGEYVPDETMEALRKIPGIEPMVLNPFENINSSSVFLKNEDLRKTSYVYAASCGVAFRSLVNKS
jgi:Tfp pilus assembly PilM family ATPase